MKMIISAKRNPALSREGFFHHLAQVHWPLVRDHPSVAAALMGYVQNHAHGPDSPPASAAPLRIASERDSVIELYFDGEEGLRRLAENAEYMAHIRPDEARFNDLASNVMVKTREVEVFTAAQPGRCKRFDFIARQPATDAAQFRQALEAQAERQSLDPVFNGRIDRLVLNWVRDAASGPAGQGFGAGHFDCVRELWAGSTASLDVGTDAGGLEGMVDRDRSFCVFATEFVKIAPCHAGPGPAIDRYKQDL